MRQLSLLPQETWLQNGRFTTARSAGSEARARLSSVGEVALAAL